MTTQTLEGSRRSAPSLLSGLDGFATEHQDTFLLIGRILMGLIFVQSGFAKLMDIPAFAASLAQKGVPEAALLAYVGAPVEFLGGLALLLGFATRYAAAMMIVFVIVATLTSHRYWEYADIAQRRAQEVNFYKNLTIIGGMFFAFVTAGGRFSLDGLLRRRG
jgi:putative oxidoreductase